jgi:hypothetical protein
VVTGLDREDIMEERQVCQTSFNKDCQPVEVQDCMEITELSCKVDSKIVEKDK